MSSKESAKNWRLSTQWRASSTYWSSPVSVIEQDVEMEEVHDRVEDEEQVDQVWKEEGRKEDVDHTV